MVYTIIEWADEDVYPAEPVNEWDAEPIPWCAEHDVAMYPNEYEQLECFGVTDRREMCLLEETFKVYRIAIENETNPQGRIIELVFERDRWRAGYVAAIKERQG